MKQNLPIQERSGAQYPIHTGLHQARPMLTPQRFEDPPYASARTDQESHQDSNLIRNALRRAQKAETEISHQRSLVAAALFCVPAAFFLGIILTLGVSGWIARVNGSPILLGSLVALIICVVFGPAAIATAVAQRLIMRIDGHFGGLI